MIHGNSWSKYCIWEHSTPVKELYARRCRREVEEMTCQAQAAEILQERAVPGDILLDVGCGSGYFYHSLRSRKIPVDYYGIDAAPSLIAIGHQYLPNFGLPVDRLQVMRIEDFDGEVDFITCINVLSNIDNYHRPLERMLQCARKMVILRESCGDKSKYQYVRDKYLDEGWDLRVYVNTYDREEIMEFIRSYGFSVRSLVDRRTGGQPELVIDYPHYWQFIIAERL
ncbi:MULTISPECIES: class I SAM-dependent methyltransferase [Spirulina sp. CCY15215]|uniref:class I SAM-dependent methyltransferase n=1 Tax=Spirulina sp. CCY15215 TaxID=2767591 RepID=UPI001952A047